MITKDNAAQWLPLVQAMAEGKEIQYLASAEKDQRWRDTIAINDNDGWKPTDYRIKPEPRLRPCTWTHDIDSDSWDTKCGGKFCLMNDTPLENHMKFCCYCGGGIREVLTPPKPKRRGRK